MSKSEYRGNMSEQGADKAGFIDFYTQILVAQFERLNFAQLNHE